MNYAKGTIGGVKDWGVDALNDAWRFLQHPIESVTSTFSTATRLFTKENLDLLFSPTKMSQALGDVASRIYWAAWDSCKESVIREYDLNPDDYRSQQAIHEIAAGRMLGYVAPDLVLLALSAGAGATAKMSKAGKVMEVSEAIANTELKMEKINEIARSARYLEDVKQFPLLRRIEWLTEPMWEALKKSPRLPCCATRSLDPVDGRDSLHSGCRATRPNDCLPYPLE